MPFPTHIGHGPQAIPLALQSGLKSYAITLAACCVLLTMTEQ